MKASILPYLTIAQCFQTELTSSQLQRTPAKGRFQDVDLKNTARKDVKNSYAAKQRKKKIIRRKR